MRYSVKIKRQAKRKIQSLSRHERKRITDKIQDMAIDPDNPTFDIEQLEGSQKELYRLRIGDWRVIFTRCNLSRLLSIEKIGARGDIYK
jgi:mRNA interferase RelE/StbE